MLERVLSFLPDKLYLQIMFFKHFKRFINFRDPITYNEKLQWLKIYDRNPLYTTLVDKYTVKDYVSKKIGNRYVIPTLGCWNDASEINFQSLPNQFVLKWNHDSGSVIICKDKSTFNIKEAVRRLNKAKKHNGYLYGREWPYKGVKPKIIAEQYMEDEKTKELRDYKFFVFNGKVKALFIASDRQNKNKETKFDFFDEKFNHLAITNGHPNSESLPEKPIRFDEMISLAELLGNGIPHVRVDFYEVDGNIFFGEMTFFHWSGFMPFNPVKWDKQFGEWITLPSNTIK